MSLPPTVRAATLELQVLIAGRVRDGLTDGAPVGPLTVALLDRDTGASYPLRGCVFDDGSFAFFGNPETAFPLLAEQTYRLRVVARAPRCPEDDAMLDLGPIAGQPAAVSEPALLGLPAMLRHRFTAGGLPRRDLVLTLTRDAVSLRGRVHVSDDPTAGVDGAQVRVTAPAGPNTTTDATGRFVLPAPLPVARSVQIEVSRTGFETATLIYEPDFNRPINHLLIGLKQS